MSLPESYVGTLRSYTLSGGVLSGTNEIPTHPPVLIISLTRKDLNILSSLESIATGNDDTYLLISSEGVMDYYGNRLVAISNRDGVKVRQFTMDTNRPSLTSFYLDMDLGQLRLLFSETVNRTSLNTSGITLQGSPNSMDLYTLTGGSSTSYDNPELLVQLSVQDTNELKRRTLIATMESNTFISISDISVSDQYGNRVIGIESTNGMEVVPLTGYIPDTTQPVLNDFSLDLNTGIIHLTFDETVNSSSFIIDTLTLAEGVSMDTINLTLSGGALLTNDSTVLSHMLSIADLNEIKRIDICTDEFEGRDCYLIFTNETVLDMNANSLTEGPPLLANPYIMDITPPEITFFGVNMSLGNVTLRFSETVNVSTFDPTGLTLHEFDDPAFSTIAYNLTGGTIVTTEDGLQVDFYFNVNDLEFLRRRDDTFVSGVTTFLSANGLTIRDTSGIPLAQLDYRIADQFTADEVGPLLVGALLDLTQETLQLTFSETIRSSAFRPFEITILNRNDSSTATSTYQLTGGAFDSGPTFDSTIIEFRLLSSDLLEIQAREELANSSETSFIAYMSNIVTDLAENVAIVTPPIQAQYVGDGINPNIFDFLEVDLNLRRMIVEFNEPVDIATAVPTMFTLQEFPDNIFQAGANIMLTGGVFSYLEPEANQKRILILDFTAADYRRIVLESRIATSTFNTHISLPVGGVFDFAGNPLVNIPPDEGRQVITLTEDLTNLRLLNFDLDVDSGQLTLYFDNVVNLATLDPTAITVQDMGVANSAHTFTGGSSSSVPDYTIIVDISQDDLNAIKSLPDVATGPSNTFLTVAAGLIDSFGGQLTEYVGGAGIDLLAITSGVAVSNFTSDTTDPYLVTFDLDLDVGEILLTFSETVNASSLELAQIQLQNERLRNGNQTRVFVLTARSDSVPTTSSFIDSPWIVIQLGFEDMNDIKRFADLAVDNYTTYISFPNSTVLDMNGNSIVAVTEMNATMVTTFTPDTTSPILVDYTFDLNFGLLHLTFDETTNVSSFEASGLRLQNEQVLGNSFSSLTDASVSITDNDYIVTIAIGATDLNEIKRLQNLAQNRNDTFLSLTPATIADMNGNLVTPIPTSDGRLATVYIYDETPPQLLAYHLDMDSGTVHFTFDETIDVSLIMSQVVLFISSRNMTSSFLNMDVYTLTDHMTLTDDITTPSIQLIPVDQYALKLNTDLVTSINTTYLLLGLGAFFDMTRLNMIQELDFPLQAANYTADTTPPLLLSFSVDMNHGVLSLLFDEPINVYSINYNHFILQSDNDLTPTSDLSLTSGGYTNSSNGLLVHIIISDEDLNEIKRLEQLYSDITDTYLRFTQDAVRDMAGNPATIIESFEALQASAYDDDMTRPALLTFDLDMTAENLTLHFRETVDHMTLNTSGIILQSVFNATIETEYYRLTAGFVYPVDSTTLVVQLSSNDVNQLKTYRIGVSNLTTYLSIDDGAVLDQVGERVLSRLNGRSSLSVTEYTPDSTPPVLDEFSLDLNAGIVWLTFSETVQANTFNATHITFQNSGMETLDPNIYHTLDINSVNYNFDLYLQRVVLSREDLDEIKRLFLLATNVNTTYISISSGLVRDVFMNSVVEITSSLAQQVSSFIEDSTSPELVSSVLNLTSEILTLSFTETVNVSSLMIAEIELISASPADSNSVSYALRTSTPVNLDSALVEISLSLEDLNAIKALPQLAVSNTTSYIAVSSNTIQDMNSNPLVQIPLATGQQVGVVFEDVTPPTLDSFDIDMNAGTLTLMFSETVNSSSILPTELTLLGEPTNDTLYRHTLQGAESVTPGYAPTLVIVLLDTDVNELKRQVGLATSNADSYLSFTANLIFDMNRNAIVPQIETESLQVTNFTNDTTPPVLQRFDLNLTSELLTLTFSETVRVSTLNIDQTTIQRDMIISPDSYWMLREGRVITNDSTVVIVQLANSDLNEIKIRTSVATEINDTFLSATDRFVRDMNTNWNAAISTATPLQVTAFTGDDVRPELERFALDRDGPGLLTLFFTESVNASSLDVTMVTLLMAPGNVDLSYTLTSSSVTNSNDGPIIEVELSSEDLNRIKIVPQLAISGSTSFISFTEYLVTDMNNNAIVAITPDNATRVTAGAGFTQDITDPLLESFSLDVDAGTLTLNFSETVIGGTIFRERFTLRSDNTSSGTTLTLASQRVDELPIHFSIVLPLMDAELNEIKRLTSLATSIDNTWLSVEQGGVQDTVGNNLVTIETDASLQATSYVVDTTDPILLNFDLDVDSGVLTMEFDETVNASSLNVENITLQNRFNESDYFYTLTDSVGQTFDSTIITINISFFDLNQIKKIRDLASVVPFQTISSASGSGSGIGPESEPVNGNTFIVISGDSIKDMNANPVVAINDQSALEVRELTLDTTHPELVTFDLNLDTERISLTFSETVDLQTLKLEEFTIIGYDSNYTLTNGSSPSSDDYIIIVQLDITDLNNIKRDLSLAVDNASTILQLTLQAIRDMNTNPLVFVTQQVTNFVPDSISPVVLYFDLNLNSSQLILAFNETVRVETLQVSEILIQDSFEPNVTIEGSYRRLEVGVALTTDDTILVIQLLPNDTNFIKSFTTLATSANNTYISLGNQTIRDMNGNSVSFNESQLVRVFDEDATSPFIVSYELDLTAEEIRFVFDETVNINSFDATRLSLYSGPSTDSTVYTITGGSILAERNNTEFALGLTTFDLDQIKILDDLAMSINSSYLVFDGALLTDMNDNFVRPVAMVPMQASTFVSDTVAPELLEFHLDMDNGYLHLLFSETVSVSSISPSGFTLQSEYNSTNVTYTLTGGAVTTPTGPALTLNITIVDLNNLKRITSLATDLNNTFISITRNAIADVSDNLVVAINSTNALQAANFTEDLTNPTLLSFNLDFDGVGILWLTFDETILVSSVNTTFLELVNSDNLENITERYIISTSELLSNRMDDPIVPISLSRLDSNEIKKLRYLATDANNSHLLLDSSFTYDMNLNEVNSIINPLSVTLYTPDTTPPQLESFVVAMDTRTLHLQFSETVNISSLDVAEITLQDGVSPIGLSLVLSNLSYVTVGNEPIVPIRLSTFDANLLTATTNLFNGLNNSYISLTNLTVSDMNANQLVTIEMDSAQQAIDYMDDVTNTTLISFTVDLDNWTISLSFDETVALETVDFTKFHVYSDAIGTLNITLSNGSYGNPYTHYPTLSLIESDVCIIKRTERIWTVQNNTWLFLEQGAVFDWTMQNPLNEISLQSVSDPVEMLPPILESFTVNMTGGVFLLNFNEPVQALSLTYQRILLQNTRFDNHTDSYRLSGGRTPSENGKQVLLVLTFRDLNAIKAHTELYTSINTAFITMENGTIRDMVNNPLAPVRGLQASMYMDDITDPYLNTFDINMNSGQLFLTFSETVDVSSFNVTGFTLQEDSAISYADAMTFHTFTMATVAYTSDVVELLDNKIVIFNISLHDLNEIKRKRIAEVLETTWLTISSNSLVDNNNQPNLPNRNGINAVPVSNHINDTTSPLLDQFNLSLDQGTLTLFFSETVAATTLDVTKITLLSNREPTEYYYTLTTSSLYLREELSISSPGMAGSGLNSGSGMFSASGGVAITSSGMMPQEVEMMSSGSGSGTLDMDQFLPLSSFDSSILTIYLSHEDLDNIKILTGLASNRDNSYLAITEEGVSDMVGNRVVEINTTEALQVSMYKLDVTRPQLRAFSFDLDSGNLTLTFTETVNTTSLDVTMVTLLSNLCGGVTYTLTSRPPYPVTTATFSSDGPIVVLNIGYEDLDSIKNLRELASERANTLLSITNYTVSDNAGNRVISLDACAAPMVTEFTHDTTRPELVSFDIDLNNGRLIVTFSETVKIVDSLDVTQLTVQSASDALDSNLTSYTLSANSTSSFDVDSRFVTILIGFEDLNEIKYRTELATNDNSTFLSLTENTIVDLADNRVVAVPTTAGLGVRVHTPDITSPVLVSFDLNMNTTTLTLTFSETVNASSLNVGQIAIQDDVISSSDYHSSPLYLTPGTNETFTDSDNSYILVVQLGPADRNELKKRRSLAISTDTTYLTLRSDAILDMNDNFVQAIIDGNALQVVQFTPDTRPPALTRFVLDMNAETLTLTFDETVQADSLLVTYLTLHSINNTVSHTLTAGLSSMVDSTFLRVYLNINDLNEIKRLVLCREVDDCYLQIRAEGLFDMRNNPIEDSSRQVDVQIPDITSPQLVRFETNLTSEILTLTFSETVNASSVNFDAFTLQDFFEASTNFTLTSGTVRNEEDGTIIELSLSLEDLNAIKLNTDLYTFRFNSWLSYTAFAIHDMAMVPNYVEPRPNTPILEEGLVTSLYTADSVRPELLNFDLNLTSDALTLYFSETVLARSLNITQISLQSSLLRNNDSQWHSLQMGDAPLFSMLRNQGDYHVFTVAVGTNDTNIIKVLTDLATIEDNTFISITASLVEDVNENAIVPIPITFAQIVRVLYVDRVNPDLVAFELDLDNGELILTFSESINASSLQAGDVQLLSTVDGAFPFWRLTPPLLVNNSDTSSGMASGQSAMSGSGSSFFVSGSGDMEFEDSVDANVTNDTMMDRFAPYHSFTVSPNSPIVTIQLGFIDLNQIKRFIDLATSVNNTFVALDTGAFADMNGNPLNEVPTFNATQVATVRADTTSPELVAFSLNLTSEILTLTFDETVNASSLQPDSIAIQNAEYTHLVSMISWYRLTGGTTASTDDYIIEINLDSDDLNIIKMLTEIATSNENTFITITSDLVEDMSGNNVMEIINGRGLQVETFFSDLVAPILIEFHLDVDQAMLHLTFSETVNASCFDVTQITLQDDRSNLMNRTRQLTTQSRDVFGIDNPIISIILGESDLNSIKATEMFGLGIVDTWITLNQQLVKDMNGNYVVAIMNGEAQQAANYTPDVTRPFLLEYHLDFIVEEMTLHFNEPMNVSMINYTAITVQDSISADDEYTLTGGAATATDYSRIITIAFNELDIDFFKSHASLTTSVEDTFISFTSDAFYDLATVSNPVIPIVNGTNATQASTFTYYNAPLFSSVTPTAGRASGGTIILIEGANFGSYGVRPGARNIDILINFLPAINSTVILDNTTVAALTPPANPSSIAGSPVVLTITIDNSVLMINISDAFTYLEPPQIISIFPNTATLLGGTTINITGNNFGPTENGPMVIVTIGNYSCSDVVVYSNMLLSCVTPSLTSGTYDIRVTVDEVSANLSNIYRSIELPAVVTVTPSSTYRFLPTEVNITGTNFGPLSASNESLPLTVLLTTPTNISLCTNPRVIIEDTVITCTVQPNLGPANVTVIFDDIESVSTSPQFWYFDNAGNFSFERSEFTVSETALFANITLIRHNYPAYPSPATVTVQAYDGTAISGRHFEALNITFYMDTNTNEYVFMIPVTYGSYLPDQLRKGADDDVIVNLRISEVVSDHGSADVEVGVATLRIKALCQVLSYICLADWDVESNTLRYLRIPDDLP